VGGLGLALRWLGSVAGHLPACIRAGHLQAADSALGSGPFALRHRRSQAVLTGPIVVSGIREIWVRDVYLSQDFLRIDPDAIVVDLGANMGNFSMLALGHGPGVRLIAVEPSAERNECFRRQLAANGWEHRVRLERCFLGEQGTAQTELLEQSEYQGAEFISQVEFIERNQLARIDFLKCDIEGSEFGLLTPDSWPLPSSWRPKFMTLPAIATK
jgi:FkbM family methyltransferase